jgi:hypothetical protein
MRSIQEEAGPLPAPRLRLDFFLFFFLAFVGRCRFVQQRF